MGKVVGIRFKPQGKTYDFDPGVYVLSKGDKVIVETEQGLGFGTVATPARQVSEEMLKKPLKKIHRIATPKDLGQYDSVLELEKEAFEYCEKCIADLKLDMNLFSVDSTFDSSKLTFFFTADGRVDFRELVKMLVRHFRVRIELRQIGVRHQAKMCGGLGRCGRETCCTSFMSGFVPVSVKMAKVQNLSLNPTKISGLCGRLMCCLTFEHDTYKELKDGFPKLGKMVNTPSGKGKVFRHNLLKGKVSVRLEDGTEMEIEAKLCTKPGEPLAHVPEPEVKPEEEAIKPASTSRGDDRKRRPRRKKRPGKGPQGQSKGSQQGKGSQGKGKSSQGQGKDSPEQGTDQKDAKQHPKQGQGRPKRNRNKRKFKPRPDARKKEGQSKPKPGNDQGKES